MKFTIHIPDARAAALDRVATKAFAGNRSAAIDAAIDPLLERHGELPGSPTEQALEKARAVIELVSPARAAEIFDRELAAAACLAADGGSET